MNKLLSILQAEGLFVSCNKYIPDDLQISYITADSRQVKENTLFVCKGYEFKKEYLVSAVEKGACVYMSEKEYEVDIPCIIVNNVRKASSVAARWFYDYPGDKMILTGITGTKGKTTTAYILKSILDKYKAHDTAIFSTMETDTVKERKISHLTTPEPIDLQRLFSEAKEYGVEYTVMEVSSQAVKMSRVYDQHYKIGIFLNIGEDHIGDREHASMEEYVSCKTSFLTQCGTVIINRGTDYFERAYNASKNAKQIIYGYTDDCDAVISELNSDTNGVSFKLSYNGDTHIYSSNLIGEFNAENLTAAILAAYELGIDYDTIESGIKNINVPGRMTLVKYNDINIIIDYAHNYLSFVKLYETVKKSFKPVHIHSVFGVPGERSAVRIRDLGMAAQEYADYIYLTADDPGFEKVSDLCGRMKAYISKPCVIIEDREEAVRAALDNAKPGDVVILAGKGAETTQRVRGGYLPYPSDKKVAEDWIAGQSR
ncbi:MAG: UDP-N-acetylmuramyl-tripeptide synthetase [Lachnospiraceae bacterium]|nr:UDP-N-acetylmuramyl-tripeptide synthetase [Lachnospiraceae bacterium]